MSAPNPDAAAAPVPYIENKTCDEIGVGDIATLTRTLKPQDTDLFAVMSGDVNPAHVDAEYAKTEISHGVIAGTCLNQHDKIVIEGVAAAVSAAAAEKGIVSKVAGIADILVAPDLESANMMAKQLIYLAGAVAAGIVLGAQVPIILTSCAESRVARLASCALAQLFVSHRTEEAS